MGSSSWNVIISCILLLNILCLICIGLSAEGEWDDLAIEWHLWSQPNNRPVHRRALSVILSCEQIIGWNTETRILRARQSTCPCQSLGPIVGNPRLSMATAMNLSIERNHSYLSKMRFSSSCWMTTWQVTKVEAAADQCFWNSDWRAVFPVPVNPE